MALFPSVALSPRWLSGPDGLRRTAREACAVSGREARVACREELLRLPIESRKLIAEVFFRPYTQGQQSSSCIRRTTFDRAECTC